MSYEAMKRGMQLTATWLCLLATAATFARAQESSAKWSRQLENAPTSDTDSLDWIPLAQPLDGSGAGKDRSGNGRVLTYSQTFPPSARFGDLTKPGLSPGSQFDFSYPFPRYSNGQDGQGQALPLRQGPPPALKTNSGQEPTSQSFFKFEMPFHSNEAGQAQSPPTLQTGYQIQHTFGGGLQAPSSLFSPPSLFGQQQAQPFGSEFHTLAQKPLNKPLRQQNYIQDILPPKSHAKPTQPSLQSVTPQVFPLDPEPESIFGLNKAAPSSAPASSGGQQQQQQQQEVQLLYVPYDTLYNQQRQQSGQSRPSSSSSNFEVNKFNVNPGLPAVNPYQINQFYTQDPNADSDFFSSGTTARPSTTSTSQPHSIFQSFGQSLSLSQQQPQPQPQPQAQTLFSTAKPKPKAHQPPLAMFLLRSSSRPSQSDVVAALRSAHSISVIDSPTKQTPEIFVGPAGMPIPDGYVKFDLPYLSQLAQTRDLSDVSFFVAPLSYRTPNGFNKILLPEPHVGSIVVNRAKDSVPVQTQPPPQRQQRPYAAVSSTRNPFETTTQTQAQQAQAHQAQSQQAQQSQKSGAPVRGNKFSYYYVQDGIQEVSSPKIPAKQERHKKKRPQNVQVEHQQQQQPIYRPATKTQNPFDTLNQIGGDDFFKSLTNKPTTTSSTSTSTTSTTSSTTSTTAAPTQPLFTYSTRPQVEFPGASGHLYPEYLQPVQEQQPRLTTRPPTATTVEEENRMKQYFRQQDAFRQRPLTTIPPAFEQVQYTPSAPDYEVPTTQRIKSKHRVNIYTPAAVPVTTSDVGYQVEQEQAQEQAQAPLNHRPSYNQVQNEILDNSNVDYEPNPYHVPSELPALTPDIPGLVNNLQEKDKLQPGTTITPQSEPENPETRPTRRPLLRTRKPAVSKVVTTSSVSYSESESSGKVPHRIRRPYGNRGTAAGTASTTGSGDQGEDSAATPTPTRRPTSARNPLIRNPNRIRYRPTTEERHTLKVKTRKGSKNGQREDQDLDYQRDVLKQNYPVFKGTSSAPSRRPTSPTAIPSSYDFQATTEGPASESQQVYTVTPSNSIDSASEQGSRFPNSLLEPMQIAQHYQEFSKDNYGPGYFPNQEDLTPTEGIVRNEVSPIYTTLATTTPSTTTTSTPATTEAAPTTTTRRSPFVRRNYPRLRTTTTTEPPVTSTTPSEERPSIRSRLPPRRVVKVRQRQRRPGHPASSTAAPEEEVQEPATNQKPNLRKLSRYNQEPKEKETPITQRRRYKQPFQLEGQESQWSPSSDISSNSNNNANANTNANANSFKPLNPKYKTEAHSFENEPEIVTVGPTEQPETYEFNVAADLGGSAAQRTTTLKAPNLKPEKSFAELLEEVMGKVPEELATESPNSSSTTTSIGRLNRRGKWKKSRVTSGSDNGENFETAESQNLGPQLYNALQAATSEKEEQQPKTTTPLAPAATEAETAEAIVTTTAASPTTPEEYEVTTARALEEATMASTLPMETLESATRRMDTAADVDVDGIADADGDLETQPSLFSEVKKQLHDLFAIEESEDEAVNAALAAVGKRRQEYTSIKRTTPATSTDKTTLSPADAEPTATTATTTATEEGASEGSKDNFHKDLMEHVVYATSTSTKVTSETEICYRGRCIRSEDLPANHKLH
ncbi:LOW QUALITY PROTEIN: flocculation protein FLO11 [Drosophila obscura]|uniref:LOW QUALITY PROTEIN: flocculation protein FLO11 n=1 Tax=Drosophila obscura TaxID=7282 RepID=UPI001BB285A8|nr:LOW QUALITY PROTEIN: flocculation protein FLO11 [Drosophila obscura]